MAKLTFVLEDGQEIVVPLAEHVTLGRGEDNDVVVDDERVSKRHAELVRNADGSIQIFDSNSTAGTFVNGERVRSHTILHGDRLAFGPLTAVLDLTNHEANGSVGLTSRPGSETQVLTLATPVRADRIATPRRSKGGGKQAEQQKALATLAEERARLEDELDAVKNDFLAWQKQAEEERAAHYARMEKLRADEKRLAPVKTALTEAEAAHAEWLGSIQALSTKHAEQATALQQLTARHEQKSADLQRLADDEAAARHELEGLATHRDQALAHLQQIRAESVHDETALDELRRQLADLETRSQRSKEMADVREDQVKAAEKKLELLSQQRAQIEAHIHELSGIEEKMAQAFARCQEAETRHAALETENQRSAAAVKDLAAKVAELEKSHQQAVASASEAQISQQQAEKSLQQVREELTAQEKALSARRAALETEARRLAEIETRRSELELQCQELAETGQKLAAVKSQLAAGELDLGQVKASLTSGEAQIATQTATVKTLTAEETAAKGRIEVLHSRENDLRAELTQLATAERSQRARFEEVRQLADEAEKEYAAQRERLADELETSRGDLTDLVSKLQPLRDWKEAMDQLYARLATLPQDSPEARDLWHEIEKEKAGLHELIVTARSQALPAATRGPLASIISNGENRAVGNGFAPGHAQETTLRSRLSHLRENVQREESRLEQIRLERIRHDAPRRAGPAAEAMLREQSRHLEIKIRQEQERHHALLHHIELAQAEEDKRRERIGEQEHRLAELRADITEAERQRSEIRQQADLAHAELKNYEAAIDRAAKITAA